MKYHAGGIRVEEVGGWTGIGWALEAGGTITRTVRGLPDEHAAGYFNTGHTFYSGTNWTNPSAALLGQIENETLDSEPDQFFFSFAGRSGSFVMGPTTSVSTVKDFRTTPFQKLRIVPTIGTGVISAWSIQTEDGTRYTFSAIETNTDFNRSLM
jgi:hypothetical protein